jgi:YD repeat-containing protein
MNKPHLYLVLLTSTGLGLTSAFAQQDKCSTYPNSICLVSDAWFSPQVGPQTGSQFSTGNAACGAAASPPSYQNPVFYIDYPDLGTGCQYDVYQQSGGNLVYQGTYFYQNWVLGIQQCPAINQGPTYYNNHPWKNWTDANDISVSINGRLWCAYCKYGTAYGRDGNGNMSCVPIVEDRYHDKPLMCQAGYGHPIYPLTGSKRLVVDAGRWLLSSFDLSYDTRRMVPANAPGAVFSASPPASFGALWESSLHKRLVVESANNQTTIQAGRGLGGWVSFVLTNGSYVPDADVNDRLVAISGGWRYYDAANQSEETYDSNGVLQTLKHADGTTLSFTYSTSSTPSTIAPVADLLITVADQYGRSLQFTYEQPSGLAPHILTMTASAPEGTSQTTRFAYDTTGNLKQITWPDQSTRQLVYEDANHPWALTGVIDENAKRLYTYAYDTNGYAIDTQAAGGVDHYHASWDSPPSWNIVDTYDSTLNVIWRDHYWVQPQNTVISLPNGQSSTLGAANVLGMNHLSSQSQPAGSGCSASTSSEQYDANGNATQKDDFDGHRACYAYDATNHETTRVEGLSNTATCSSVLPAASPLPAGSRKTSTQWHPDWRLAVKVAEPGAITTNVYNGQPDPFNANALASCAPSTALLPDGKPIAVLCKKVIQATTDTDGSQAFNAPLDTKTPNRVWSYTYNQYGQVLTAKGPRTDVNDTTTYAYYSDTTSSHTIGDLQSVTDALNHVTTYTQYDPSGNLLEKVDANNVVTDYTYDARQRLKTVKVGSQTTTYDYWPTGLLKQVTFPDQSTVAYSYDDAHRLTDVTDSQGNSVHYVLDNAGNRTAEQYKDPSGALKSELDRIYDALGRVQQTTGRE